MAIVPGNATVTQVDADNSIDLNMPSGILAKDIIVALFRASSTTLNIPAGWTKKATPTTGALGMIVCWRRADGSESATYTFTTAVANLFTDARAFILRGCIETGDPFDVAPVMDGNASNATAPALSLVTVTPNAYLVYACAHNNAVRTTLTPPSGMTNFADEPTRMHLFGATQPVAGASGSKQMVSTAVTNNFADLMAFKPEPSSSAGFLGLL